MNIPINKKNEEINIMLEIDKSEPSIPGIISLKLYSAYLSF